MGGWERDELRDTAAKRKKENFEKDRVARLTPTLPIIKHNISLIVTIVYVALVTGANTGISVIRIVSL